MIKKTMTITSKLSAISFLSVIMVLGTVAPAFAANLNIDDSVEASITLSHDANWESGVDSNGSLFGPLVPGVNPNAGEAVSFTGMWLVNLGGSPDPGAGIIYIVDPNTGRVSDIITASWSTVVNPGLDDATIIITVQSSAKCSDLGPLPAPFTGVVETGGSMAIQGSFVDTVTGVPVIIPSNLTIQFESGEECEIDAEKTWTHTDYNWDQICDISLGVPGFVNPADGLCYSEDTFVNDIGFRPANTNNVEDDVLANSLDPDGDGTSDVVLQVKKNGKISNMNPGAIYALTTVDIKDDLDMLKVEEEYVDCTTTTSLLELLNQKKLSRNVKVAVADSIGDVTEVTDRLYDPLDLGVVFVGTVDDSSATVKINDASLLIDGNTVYVLVKFDDQLKNDVFDEVDPLECENIEWVTSTIAGEDSVLHPGATLRFTEAP